MASYVSFAEGQNIKVKFEFTDTNATMLLHLRNSILEVSTDDDVINGEMDIHVTTTEATWRGMAAKEKYPAWEYMTGALAIKPGLWRFKKFMDCFDRSESYSRQI